MNLTADQLRGPIPMPCHPKPRYGEPCNHCGLCCMVSLCHASMLSGETKAPCAHLRFENGNALCGLVITEIKHGLEPKIQQALGIGVGCGMEDGPVEEALGCT